MTFSLFSIKQHQFFGLKWRLIAIVTLLSLGSLLSARSALANDDTLGSLNFIQPWSWATPDRAKVAGGYVTIKNTGTTDDRLIAVSSEISDRSEIHEIVIKNDIMHMRLMEQGLVIPAGKELELKPSSYHLMFFDPKRQIKAGETFKATLTFEKSGKIELIFNVERMGKMPPAKNDKPSPESHKHH